MSNLSEFYTDDEILDIEYEKQAILQEADGDDVEGEEYDGCPACNGTGEGQYDGSRCYVCKGRG